MQISQGPHLIGDTLTFTVDTTRFDTGAATDGDAEPTWRLYEDETGTPILTGTFAKLDDSNTTGFYSKQVALSVANGFEENKTYSIRVSGAVNSVTGALSGSFKIAPLYVFGIITRGTAQGGSASTIQLASSESFADDVLNGATAAIVGGTGVGQRRVVSDYVGSTDTASVTPDWAVNPDSSSVYVFYASPPAEGVAQTGDAYAIVTHGTYGNEAIRTDIDAVATNVSTLIGRITSTLFAGITSFAAWFGALAGKSADSGTLAEIQATDAGASYDNTTDSKEALRDRGDAAWTTATGFSTHSAADVWAAGTRTLTSGANIALAKGTGVTGFNDLSAAQVNAEVDTALADYDAPTKAELDSGLAGLNDPTAAAIADAVWTEAIADHDGVAGSTAEALSNAGAAGTPPTVGEIADAVWDEAAADHVTSGTTGAALGAAGSAGDPWETSLPGAYGSGTAGKIIGDNLNATVGSRATQTSVDDLPTNAELATALAGADDATLAAIAGLNNLSAAQVNAEVDQALADVGLTSTVTGRIDAAVSTRATPAQVATELGTYDAPTKAELDAAIATLATAANLAAAKTVVDAIKLKTDLIPSDPAETSDIPSAATVAAAVLAAAALNPIDANVQEINDVTLQGNGSTQPWGPA